ncbi:unnamed protein product [Urochloa humidicola]
MEEKRNKSQRSCGSVCREAVATSRPRGTPSIRLRPQHADADPLSLAIASAATSSPLVRSCNAVANLSARPATQHSTSPDAAVSLPLGPHGPGATPLVPCPDGGRILPSPSH